VSGVPLVTRACVVLACDICGDGWADLDSEPHFANRAAASKYATAAGWILTGARAECVECTQVEVCALAGHSWGRWTPAGPFPSADGGTWHGRVRHCRICTSAEWDPPVRRHGSRHGQEAG
jgi:hypothetical protein